MINKTEKDEEDASAHAIGKEMEEFESFIKKKKVQNEALKKIINKLDSNKNNVPNK